METAAKNRLWFIILMAVGLGVAIFRIQNHFAGPNTLAPAWDSADAARIHYTEGNPILSPQGVITALAVSPTGAVYLAFENAIQEVGGATFRVDGTPTCLAVDEAGTLFVGMQDHVQVVKAGVAQAWSSRGAMARLTSIDVDEWYVYVADAGNRRIWRYKKEGSAAFEIGKKDWANGIRGFEVPGACFDLAIRQADGSLWAANPGRHALENFRPDGMPLSSWGRAGKSLEHFSGRANPSQFTLMSDGGFVTVEQGIPRVKIYHSSGAFRTIVASADQFNGDPSILDVAAAPDGTIYLLDATHNQVRVFKMAN